MSTLGSLMLALGDTGIKPYNEQELIENRIRSGNLQNQTGLLELAALTRQQETAARTRQALQENPGLVLGGGGSTLASPALTMPQGGAPMTQQTVMPGQPPGAARRKAAAPARSRTSAGSKATGNTPARDRRCGRWELPTGRPCPRAPKGS